MKLTAITTPSDSYYCQVRLVMDNLQPLIVENTIHRLKYGVRGPLNPRPLHYLFIESTLESGVLGENAISQLFSTGLSKIRSALTPGPQGDLETLLSFMSPKGGGLDQVNKLIKQAGKANGSILEDQAWWEELFAAFNVADQETKNLIMQQVQEDILSGGTAAQQIDQEEQQNQEPDKKKQKWSKLDRGNQEQQLKTQLNDLLARLGKINASKNVGESITKYLARTLLNDHRVQNNIGFIGNTMLRKVGQDHRTHVPVLSEAGLLDKLRSALGDTGLMLANPALAKRTLSASTASNNNERAAKLAVRLLSDQARQSFEAALSANGLTPEQIGRTLEQWKKLKPKAEAGDQNALQTYNAASETLKKAFKLFNHGNTKHEFKPIDEPETPPDAAGIDSETDQGADIPLPSIKDQISELPNILDADQLRVLWGLITGNTPDIDVVARAIQKAGGSIAKAKALKAALRTKRNTSPQ